MCKAAASADLRGGKKKKKKRADKAGAVRDEASLPGLPRRVTDARHWQEAAVKHSSLVSRVGLCSLRTAHLLSGVWRFG